MFVKEYAKSLVIAFTNFTMTMLKGIDFPYMNQIIPTIIQLSHIPTKIKKAFTKMEIWADQQHKAPKADTQI